MPHAQHQRGAHLEDRELFSDVAIEKLRLAAQDCLYLLDRGAASWVNLLGYAVQQNVRSAWLVDLAIAP